MRTLGSIEELVKKVNDCRDLYKEDKERISKILMLLSQATYEKSQGMFICGFSTEKNDGMPEYIDVCPSYGADRVETYKRVINKYSTREY